MNLFLVLLINVIDTDIKCTALHGKFENHIEHMQELINEQLTHSFKYSMMV